VAGSTSAGATTDVGGRTFGEKREKSRGAGRGDRVENKVEGCPEPVVPLIIGVIP